MGVIHKLPTELSLKIAAGEVVERPSSVVKELVDNSLDAGATSVRVEIEAAGSKLIRVIDNGSGIAREDLALAVERHATSKIRMVEDLAGIISLGFRGEALAAISSVCELEIQTRPHDEDIGSMLIRRPDAEPEISDTGCPAGTRISVHDLFKNVPARRKFLKTETTEFKRINEVVVRAALAWERVQFVLVHNGKTILDLPRAADRGERISALLGKKVFSELHPVSYASKDLVVEGYTSRPSFTRPTSGHVMTFVNDRFVQNKTLQAAVMEAYRSAIEPRRHPTGVLYYEMDPAAIDINVHPTKMEIKFVDERAVFRGTLAAVKSAIAGETLRSPAPEAEQPVAESSSPVSDVSDKSDMPPPISRTSTPASPTRRSGGERDYQFERDFGRALDSYIRRKDAAPSAPSAPAEESTPPPPPTPAAPPASRRSRQGHHLGSLTEPDEATERLWGAYREGEHEIRPIGQAMNLYIVGEMGKSLVIIDQHAAHERILFEKFRNQLNNEAIQRQSLMFPLTLELGAGEAAALEEHGETFRELGFEIRPFGENTFIVETIPADLEPASAEELLRDLADDLRDGVKQWQPEDRREHMLATMACRAAIKAGDPLTEAEIAGLVNQINRLNQPETCPHGRPKVIVLTDEELRKQFKRT